MVNGAVIDDNFLYGTILSQHFDGCNNAIIGTVFHQLSLPSQTEPAEPEKENNTWVKSRVEGRL